MTAPIATPVAARRLRRALAGEARRLLAPLFAAAGPPLVDGMRPMRFADASMGGTALAAALAPHATGGSFLNFLGDPARTPTAFAPADYETLRAVKAAYDPDELFSIGHAIAPADTTLTRRSARRSRAASA